MMVVLAILQGLGPYAWFLAGAVFLIAEVLLPGINLIWFGVAASLTGVTLFAFDIDWEAQMASFIAYCAISVIFGRMLAARTEGDGADRVNLGPNQLIGRELALSEPIVNGFGHAYYGDSHWRVTGADQPAGTRVRVTGIEASTLRVEPVAAAGAEPAAAPASASA